ncbi:hypothetical protein BUALT_Bualt10G0059500 [Buddleja alternifolia]|uniref:Zinc knuckle CX2CX4HX4C domain-containing protein n=1 Tax=Buddleja alternifolia TaxID=168488 RepID=A0AAV6X154_9LAMI|nr:hypothetical protein BUALT_Bualt10G0059500 [Buddleja alternifolia]
MDEDLVRMTRDLSVTEKEASKVIIPDQIWNYDNRIDGSLAVARLLTWRNYNFAALKNTITRAMNPVRGMDIQRVNQDRFILIFHHELDLKVHGLPLKKKSKEVARFIGDSLGSFIAVDENSLSTIWINDLRIRVQLNVTQPLQRVMHLQNTMGKDFEIKFTYEKLPNFCYLCGNLGHFGRRRPLRYDKNFLDPGTKTQYGEWLRASTRQSPNRIRPSFGEQSKPLETNDNSDKSLEFCSSKSCHHQSSQVHSDSSCQSVHSPTNLRPRNPSPYIPPPLRSSSLAINNSVVSDPFNLRRYLITYHKELAPLCQKRTGTAIYN